MIWLDYAVAGVFAVSLLVGAWRGLVREVISVLGWIIAFLAANLLAGPIGPSMPEAIPTPELRVAAAFVAVFVVALVLASLAGLLLSGIVKSIGLGGVDRLLGAVFGAARAVLVIVAAALLAGLTSAPRQAYWRDSVSGPMLVQIARALQPLLPQTLTERLRYD
jgi:membrane protein required for colicin V production